MVKTIWLSVRVNPEWHRRVKAEAALRGITLAEMVRKAVDEWLERNPRKGEADGKETQA
ncbi:MAG: plasmid partition protein ParG [Bacillota bacterium]